MKLKITPALIPHEKFHTGTWLLPVKRMGWYYFMKKKASHTILNRSFLGTVDNPLQNLVSWLHRRGIKTTPSCAGHHLSRHRLEEIYDGLLLDRNEIRAGGLLLTDVETGQAIQFRDEHYRLPWTRREFIDEAFSYQKRGVLGLHLENFENAMQNILRLPEWLRKRGINGVTMKSKGSWLFIFTTEATPKETKDVWKMITRRIKNALR